MNPIVMDIETSGLDKINCGIWQIGAIDLNNPKEFFLEEGRIDDDEFVQEDALTVIGKSEDYLRNENKKSQEELIQNFFNWMSRRGMRNLLCQNPQFDLAFIEIKAEKYGLKKNFQHRAFDLHSIAQTIHFMVKNSFLLRKNYEKFESNVNLTNTLNFCGIPDNRVLFVDDGKGQIKEGLPHNALEDCKLAGECFFRLMHGKNLFPEYAQYEIPEHLKKLGERK